MSTLQTKRISLVAPDLAGGGMTRAYALAQALMHAGHEVEIIGVRLTNGSLYPAPPSDIKVTEISGPGRLYSLMKLVMKLDGDILYAIKPRMSSYGVALLKRWLSRQPVILDIDDCEISEMNAASSLQADPDESAVHKANGIIRSLKDLKCSFTRGCRRWLNPCNARYTRWLSKAICRADAITVNTRLLQDVHGGIYVPQCKDTSKYDPDKYVPEDCRRRYGLSAYTVLMFPGTARPHKGLEDVLIAMENLQNPDLRLVIVGGRNSSETYIEQLMRRWGNLIVRLPMLPQEKMPEVLAAAHAIVVPQRDTAIARAQFPMKLTDGMAMAKPIITTKVGDIPEILGNCGYVVMPSSPGQLEKALEDMIRDPSAAMNRGKEARDRLVMSYSLGAVGPLLSDVINTLG
jgi:glycosyltransferase involved in cell wall biosynthesis